jgi:CRISPR system Cascade subunit CasD
MTTLLLQCVAPLQVWDTQSRFGVRTTGREPSKSGIVGLLCAALGRPRTAPIDDLAALTMAVRVDKEGVILRDFHTAKDIGTSS